MNRVLVTGASGFIGRQCLRELADTGLELHAVSCRSDRQSEDGVVWHRTDLLVEGNPGRLVAEVRPSHLLHLAWYVEHGRYWASPENLRWVQATADLLKQFADQGGHRAVLAGTCAEYDWRFGYLSEGTTPLASKSLYTAAKNATRLLAESIASQANLECAWARIFFTYGPGEPPKRLVPSIIHCLKHGTPTPPLKADLYRDFLYVKDVASALEALLKSQVTGAINIASGRPTRIGEVAEAIAAKIGGAELLRFESPAERAEEPPLVIGNPARLRNELGWTPTYNLDSGLADMIVSMEDAECV